jgi:hypothetical protein
MGMRTPGMSPFPAVELHIEELVLHGFSPGDRFGIGDAIQQELERLITEQGLPGLPAESASIQRLDGGSLKMRAGARPQSIGAQLAQRVHHQLSPAQNMAIQPDQRTKGPKGR